MRMTMLVHERCWNILGEGETSYRKSGHKSVKRTKNEVTKICNEPGINHILVFQSVYCTTRN